MFCSKCGKEIDNEAVVCPHCGVPTANYQRPQEQPQVVINNTNTNTNVNTNVVGGAMVSRKSKIVALILCIFLGEFGFHRFYVGKVGTGIIWLCTMGLCGIGYIIDIVMIAIGAFKDKYGLPLR